MPGIELTAANTGAEPAAEFTAALPRCRHALTRLDLCDVPVHGATMEEAVFLARRAIRQRERLTFGMLNVAKLVNSRRDALLRDSLLDADVVLADGMPIVWLSKLAGAPLPERVAGIDLFHKLLQLAHVNGFSIYLLGAKAAVNDAVARRIEEDYPGCRIAGRRDGYFDEDAELHVATAIRESRADMLFLAMSPPKKELFMQRWSAGLGVPVIHGVGGSFDVYAGRTKRAPRWMQRSGLEWAYRVWQEPRRMWKRYLVTNTQAFWLAGRVLRDRLTGRVTTSR